jgi:adenylate cyclase class 2
MVGKKSAEQQQRPKRKTRAKTKQPAPSNGGSARSPVDMEVEIKLPVEDVDVLTNAGLTLEEVDERHFEDNWVYKLPDGKLRKGQYLRVRYVGNGDGAGRRHEGVLTYKGKSRREAASAKGKNKGKKVREEIETSVGQPDKVAKIMKRLGLQRSFRYQKYRTVYRVTLADERSLLAMYDETPIGNFLELEGEASVIEAVADAIGFQQASFISESYVEMQVARSASRGEPLGDMIFAPVERKARRRAKKPTKKTAKKKR